MTSFLAVGVDILVRPQHNKIRQVDSFFLRLLVVSIVVYKHNVVMSWCSMQGWGEYTNHEYEYEYEYFA